MREYSLLEATCKHGRLIITADAVAVQPASSGLHWSRHHWQVPREKVTGVSSYRGGYGRDLLIRTNDGRSLRVEAVAPQHALPIIQLLGHARMDLPDEAPAAELKRPHRWVRGGKLVVTSTAVALKPRILFFLRRKRHWTVARADVTGVRTARRPGMRMRYDVTVLTNGGAQFIASDVSPDNVIALTRALGHTTEAPAVPLPVREDRAAVEFALASAEEAPAPGLWAVEEDGVWEVEPQSGAAPARGWGARAGAREGTASMRFGTAATLVLLCIYAGAVLAGGRAIADGATFARNVTAPPRSISAPAAPGAPARGTLQPPLGSTSPATPSLAPMPNGASGASTSH